MASVVQCLRCGSPGTALQCPQCGLVIDACYLRRARWLLGGAAAADALGVLLAWSQLAAMRRGGGWLPEAIGKLGTGLVAATLVAIVLVGAVTLAGRRPVLASWVGPPRVSGDDA